MGCTDSKMDVKTRTNVQGKPGIQAKPGTIPAPQPCEFLGMYSKGKMTGVMPGEIKMEVDQMYDMLAADPNSLRDSPEIIVKRRAELEAAY